MRLAPTIQELLRGQKDRVKLDTLLQRREAASVVGLPLPKRCGSNAAGGLK